MCNNDHRGSCDTSLLRREQTTRTYRDGVFLPAHVLSKPFFVIGNKAGDVAKKEEVRKPSKLVAQPRNLGQRRVSVQVRRSASSVLYSVNEPVVIVLLTINQFTLQGVSHDPWCSLETERVI